jgi:hypothetical protein
MARLHDIADNRDFISHVSQVPSQDFFQWALLLIRFKFASGVCANYLTVASLKLSGPEVKPRRSD